MSEPPIPFDLTPEHPVMYARVPSGGFRNAFSRTAAWTAEQVRLISLYGTCERCGAPRDFIVTERFAGNLHYEMACTREGCLPLSDPADKLTST